MRRRCRTGIHCLRPNTADSEVRPRQWPRPCGADACDSPPRHVRPRGPQLGSGQGAAYSRLPPSRDHTDIRLDDGTFYFMAVCAG